MKESGGGPPKGPWGQGPAPNPEPKPQPKLPGGVRPPDLETLLKKTWSDVKRYLPAGLLGKRGAWAVATLAVGIWLALGFYTVNDNEQGVVLRFGAFVKHTGPGTYWHLPWPFESAYTPNVKKPNQLDIGFKPAAEAGGESDDKQDESYMLTGDENIADVQFSVFWRIKDANAYLFNVDRGKSDDVVKAAAESAMREVVGQEKLDAIQTSHRETVQLKVQLGTQAILDSYNAGIEVVSVKLQKVLSPAQIVTANNAVQKALTDQDKKRTDAEAYENTVIPQARGDAARIVLDAEGYRQQAIATAKGEAARFNDVYQEYKKAPDVTRRRLYLETMTQVLGPMNKIIVDDATRGVTLQLPPQAVPAKPAADRKPGAQVGESADKGAGK
jgi:membrane protease subunit HflK